MQLKKLTISVAAMLAMAAVGGVALAKTGQGPVSNPKRTTQTTQDRSNIQQGGRTANAAPESESNESNSESESESDGPGGHEDPPGNVDHQFEGEE